jgi:hypothetical protein
LGLSATFQGSERDTFKAPRASGILNNLQLDSDMGSSVYFKVGHRNLNTVGAFVLFELKLAGTRLKNGS